MQWMKLGCSMGLFGLSVLTACGGDVAAMGDKGDAAHEPDGGAHDSSSPPDSPSKDTGKGSSSSSSTSSSSSGCAPGTTEPCTCGGGVEGEQICAASGVFLGCVCLEHSDAGAPMNHRPNDDECLQPAAAGGCEFMGFDSGVSCSADSECTMGTDGRCIADGPIAGCHCTYDMCADDSACPSGELCVCHGSPYTDGAGNTCMPGNCRVDSDCGPDGYCSPSAGGACGSISGYYCHTADDSCVNDSDCQTDGPDVCQWSSTDNRWECVEEDLCG